MLMWIFLLVWFGMGILTSFFLGYSTYRGGEDIDLKDLGVLILVSFLGPINIIPLIATVLDLHGDNIIIKGKEK
jgi:hypothetical protein